MQVNHPAAGAGGDLYETCGCSVPLWEWSVPPSAWLHGVFLGNLDPMQGHSVWSPPLGLVTSTWCSTGRLETKVSWHTEYLVGLQSCCSLPLPAPHSSSNQILTWLIFLKRIIQHLTSLIRKTAKIYWDVNMYQVFSNHCPCTELIRTQNNPVT